MIPSTAGPADFTGQPDDFSHEQSLVFDTEKGLCIFNSCSHTGAADIIEEVCKAFPGRRVYAYVGGFHLFRKPPEEVDPFAARLKALGLAPVAETDTRSVYRNDYEQVVAETDYAANVIRITVTWIPQYYSEFKNVLDFGWLTDLQLYDRALYTDGAVYQYDYGWYYDYDEMTDAADSYAYILDDDGFTYLRSWTSDGDLCWLCEGNGLSILISQSYTSVYIYIETL